MKRRSTFLASLLLAGAAAAAGVTVEQLFSGKGRVTCSGGGTQNPLFNRECKKVTISRVTSSGGVKYEIACTDSGNTPFQMACDAYALEQVQSVF